MKKILHISKYYYPFRGGTEQIAQDCINAISINGEYEQMVLCFNHEKGDAFDCVNGVNVIRAGCFAKISSQSLSVSYGRFVKNIISEYKPNIIIFHYPNPFGAYYLLKYVPKDVKLVIYWHLDIVKQKFLKYLFVLQNRCILRRANKIIATSPNYITGSFWLKHYKEKCEVVPNCININRLKDNEKILQLSKRIKEENKGKIICLAVGRHTEYKGFSYLIKASEYLDDRYKIFITGEGELTNKLKAQAKGNKIIKFLGLVSDDELKAYMHAMDIFCFSSITKNEAFGLALAEAMYYGKPAVTFNIEGSGVNYVCINNVTGIEVKNKDCLEYANAIKLLAGDIKLREKYGKAARDRVVTNFLDSSFGDNIRKVIDML